MQQKSMSSMDYYEAIAAENSGSDESKIRTSMFYKNKDYVPILERKNYKRKLETSPEIKEKNEKVETNQLKRQKTKDHYKESIPKSKKKTKTSLSKQKKKHAREDFFGCQQVEAKNGSTPIANPNEQKVHSDTVSLSSVLANNLAKVDPQKKKFFKSRSSASPNNILLRVENIMKSKTTKLPSENKFHPNDKNKDKKPKNAMNGYVAKAKSDCKQDLRESTNLSKNDAVHSKYKTMSTKWVVNSFNSESPVSNIGEEHRSKAREENKKIIKEREMSSCLLPKTSDDSVSKKHEDTFCSSVDSVQNESVYLKDSESFTENNHGLYAAKEILTELIGSFEDDNSIDTDHKNETSGSSVATSGSYGTDSLCSSDVYPIFQRYVGTKPSKDHETTVLNENAMVIQQQKVPKTMLPKGKELFTIDAGQKLDPMFCSQCHMMYQIGVEHDESLHIKYHKKSLAQLKFQGWKNERVIGNFPDGRIIMVTEDDKNFMLKKVEEVFHFVSRELGYGDTPFSHRPNAVFLMYVHVDKEIVGFLSAESITKAYYIENFFDKNSKETAENQTDNGRSSPKSVEALCGISRLWVANGFDQDILRLMVDCLRCNFLYGFLIDIDQLAFLDPSENLQCIAAFYTKRKNFLVYK